MEKTVTFTVNGRPATVTTDAQRPLLDALREDLQLTGAKYGCGEGLCGACSVLLDGRRVFSCVTPISDVDQKAVVTIEGLAPAGSLHPVQQAFLAEGAFQCGYCTPGMIIATVALLKEKPHPTDTQIVKWLDGDLCRCCGYTRILRAVKRAAGEQLTSVSP
jgi:aerobic-type carbon monoxide dehydrogenase small subunit (CoxS/CutS family)